MREAMEVILRGNMYDLQNNHLAQKRREAICRRSVEIGGKDETNLARASAGTQ